MVLDDATAFADPENEALIQKAFAQLTMDRTVIMIAHRLSTVVGADKILVLEGGQVTEQGCPRGADGGRRSVSAYGGTLEQKLPVAVEWSKVMVFAIRKSSSRKHIIGFHGSVCYQSHSRNPHLTKFLMQRLMFLNSF